MGVKTRPAITATVLGLETCFGLGRDFSSCTNGRHIADTALVGLEVFYRQGEEAGSTRRLDFLILETQYIFFLPIFCSFRKSQILLEYQGKRYTYVKPDFRTMNEPKKYYLLEWKEKNKIIGSEHSSLNKYSRNPLNRSLI